MFFGHISQKLNYLATTTYDMFNFSHIYSTLRKELHTNDEAWRRKCYGLRMLCCNWNWPPSTLYYQKSGRRGQVKWEIIENR